MARGVSPRQSKNPDCRVCNCTPCEDSFECRRARGLSAYQARQPASSPPTKSKSKPKKAQPKLSKKKFIANLRSKNPSISDSQIKKALKKAGYSTGCLSVLILVFVLPSIGASYGVYELVNWII